MAKNIRRRRHEPQNNNENNRSSWQFQTVGAAAFATKKSKHGQISEGAVRSQVTLLILLWASSVCRRI
jgi:hypothetical protein